MSIKPEYVDDKNGRSTVRESKQFAQDSIIMQKEL